MADFKLLAHRILICIVESFIMACRKTSKCKKGYNHISLRFCSTCVFRWFVRDSITRTDLIAVSKHFMFDLKLWVEQLSRLSAELLIYLSRIWDSLPRWEDFQLQMGFHCRQQSLYHAIYLTEILLKGTRNWKSSIQPSYHDVAYVLFCHCNEIGPRLSSR